MKAPLDVMTPAFTDQLTAESGLPVPVTVATHCEPAPGATEVGVHRIATEETCEETGCDGWDGWDAGCLYPPHAAHTSIPAEARRSFTAAGLGNSGLDGMRYFETESVTAHTAACRIQLPFSYKRRLRCMLSANLCLHSGGSLLFSSQPTVLNRAIQGAISGLRRLRKLQCGPKTANTLTPQAPLSY